MFARVLWRLLRGSRGRLTVALVAVISGAAVTSALINLDLDVEHKLTREFRTLGANIVIAPQQAASSNTPEADAAQGGPALPSLMDEQSAVAKVGSVHANGAELVAAAPFLYVVAHSGGKPVVVAGTWLDEAAKLEPTWKIQGNWVAARNDSANCLVGRNAAQNLNIAPGSEIELQYPSRTARVKVAGVIDAGGADDNQIFVNLPVAQNLAGLGGKIEVVQLSVGGSSDAIGAYAQRLAAAMPELDVRPIRQVTDAEGQLLRRTRLLIVSMIVLILALTALCVLATMAALATERREDVGMMKALGGSIGRVLALFMAELGVLGAAGGLAGCLGGVLLSRWMGERVFGTAIDARWQIFPVTIGLMMAVAMAGALPLRFLGEVKPAVILRGE